ncbi:vegetative cell wall protein gp1-like [Rousettus aegyptiacus]|uniref:vegetative cell wall protein gp1-like n=1 Tax=Rousettus aegyptiacus TaxID=9407 RepID=UPI00168D3BF4|nr:vegetative cell wall protein gp1-like [Rousettus aegyptiacus]
MRRPRRPQLRGLPFTLCPTSCGQAPGGAAHGVSQGPDSGGFGVLSPQSRHPGEQLLEALGQLNMPPLPAPTEAARRLAVAPGAGPPSFGPPIAPLPSRAAPPALDLSDPPGQGHSAPRAADQQSTQPRGGPWVPLPPRPLLKIHSSEGLGSDGPLPTVLWLGYQAPEQDTSPSPTSTFLATRTPSGGSASQSEAGAQPPRLV